VEPGEADRYYEEATEGQIMPAGRRAQEVHDWALDRGYADFREYLRSTSFSELPVRAPGPLRRSPPVGQRRAVGRGTLARCGLYFVGYAITHPGQPMLPPRPSTS
jgi:hypothetical protein